DRSPVPPSSTGRWPPSSAAPGRCRRRVTTSWCWERSSGSGRFPRRNLPWCTTVGGSRSCADEPAGTLGLQVESAVGAPLQHRDVEEGQPMTDAAGRSAGLPEEPRAGTGWGSVLLRLLVAALVLGPAYTLVAFYFQERPPAGLSVAGVDVGGLTREDTAAELG